MAEKLGAILVRKGLLTQAQLDEALKAQLIYGGRLGSILIELDLLDIDTVAMVLGEQTRYPVAQEADFEVVTDATLRLLPAALAEKHLAFPLAQEGRRLKVAMASPFEIQHTDALGFITGLRILPHITPELRLFHYQAQRYGIRRDSRSMSMATARRAAQPRGAVAPAPGRGVMVPLPEVAPPPAPVRAEPGTEGIFGGLAPGQFLSDDAEDVAAEDVEWSASSASGAGISGDAMELRGSARAEAGPPMLAPSGPPQLAPVAVAQGGNRMDGPPRLSPAAPPRLSPPVAPLELEAAEEIEPEEEFEAAEEIDPTEELELVDTEEVLEGVMEEVVDPPAPRPPVFAGQGERGVVAEGQGGIAAQPPGMVSRHSGGQWSPHQPPGLNRAPGAGAPGGAGARPPASVVGPPAAPGAVAVRPGASEASTMGPPAAPGGAVVRGASEASSMGPQAVSMRPSMGDASSVGLQSGPGVQSPVPTGGVAPSGAPGNAGAARPAGPGPFAELAVPPGMVAPGGRPPSGTGLPSIPQGAGQVVAGAPGARPSPGAGMAPVPGGQGMGPLGVRPPSSTGTPSVAGPVPAGMASTRPSSAGVPSVPGPQGAVPPGMTGARPPSSAGVVPSVPGAVPPGMMGARPPSGTGLPSVQGPPGVVVASSPMGAGPQGPVPPGMMGTRPPSSTGMPSAQGPQGVAGPSAPLAPGSQGAVPPGMAGARPPSSTGTPSIQGPQGPGGSGAGPQGSVPPGMAGARPPPGTSVPAGPQGAPIPPGMMGARPPSNTGMPSAQGPQSAGPSAPPPPGSQGTVPPGMMGARPPSRTGMPTVPGAQGAVPPGMGGVGARPVSGPPGAVPPGMAAGAVPPGMAAGAVPPGAVPLGMAAGAAPPGVVPPGLAAGAAPPGAVPLGQTAGAVPPGAMPPGMAAGAVPPSAVSPGMSAGAVSQGAIPQGLAAGSVPQGMPAGAGAQGAIPQGMSASSGPHGAVLPGMPAGTGSQGAIPPGMAAGTRASSAGMPAVSGPPGTVPHGVAGARPPSGTGLPSAPGPQGVVPPGLNVAAGGRPASVASGPVGPPPGMARPPQPGVPSHAHVAIPSGGVQPSLAESPQSPGLVRSTPPGSTGPQPPGMAPKGMAPFEGGGSAQLDLPSATPTSPHGVDAVIEVSPGQPAPLEVEWADSTRPATESVSSVSDAAPGITPRAIDGLVGLPAPASASAGGADAREVPASESLSDVPESWGQPSEDRAFALSASIERAHEGSAPDAVTDAPTSWSIASKGSSFEVVAPVNAAHEGSAFGAVTEPPTSWSIASEEAGGDTAAPVFAAREGTAAEVSADVPVSVSVHDGIAPESTETLHRGIDLATEDSTASAPPGLPSESGASAAVVHGATASELIGPNADNQAVLASEPSASTVGSLEVMVPDFAPVSDAPALVASDALGLDRSVAPHFPEVTQGEAHGVESAASVHASIEVGQGEHGPSSMLEEVHSLAVPTRATRATEETSTEVVTSESQTSSGLVLFEGAKSSFATRDDDVPEVGTVTASTATGGAIEEAAPKSAESEPSTPGVASSKETPVQAVTTVEFRSAMGESSERVSFETSLAQASDVAASEAPSSSTSTDPTPVHSTPGSEEVAEATPQTLVDPGDGSPQTGLRISASADLPSDASSESASSSTEPSTLFVPPTGASESTSVAYLDASEEAAHTGIASTHSALPASSADSTAESQGTGHTSEGEPWKLVRSRPSDADPRGPATSDDSIQPKSLAGDEDAGESLELEAAGALLASHGEQSTRVEPTTQRDVTGTSDSASELPAGNVSPQRAVTEPEAAASNLPDSSTATESKQASGEPAPAAAVTFDAPEPLSSVGDFKSARAATGESHDAASGEASLSPEGTVVSLDAVRAANAEPAALEPPKPAVTRRAPIELDDLPATDDAPMQLASTWEFVGWQGSEGNGTIGHVAENTWEDRAVDLDGTVQRAAPASELPLASAWDFIQQPWQPQAREQSEALRALLAATDAPVAPGSEGPAVSAEQVLTALEDVGTQGVLGKVLLAYCAGRFQRAFLLGESFGLVRVGHAWGPGCDSPQVSALKVDLEAPSLLMSALEQLGPSSFDTPTCPQDEAIFTALGGPSSRLLVVPIRARGRPVAFVIADSGGTPVASTTLDELSRVSAKASEVYDRLPASRAD
ncbi:hypothetical protein FJV41_35515 [Myxococcus llanfairpwllgwyngyllgogerychwyrndrobwllllantysiliogogogochensis]|uniref:Type II secretion system protein GspE N-terminal domain-containing protein n=1 Tax=Myxococcus llanfairpwllgwyngyllgogerychwyrndrobwllllantysiliogogogochensis TaxID=2590453 RepID=A0A540WQ93_9BACT|nr:hypothetical protein FJV41_35515 [Myxococcus llanfairpwllgwyngyllgogerychwyrndrobwllllantysiliogogogochensis]